MKLWPSTAASETGSGRPASSASRRDAISAVKRLGNGERRQVADRARRRRPRARAGRRRAASGRSRPRTAGSRRRASMIARTAGSGKPGDEAREQLAHRRLGERLEVERREGRAPAPQSGPPLEELGAGERDDVDRDGPAPVEQVVDEVEQAGVGAVQVLEHHDHGCGRRQALEEGPPGGEQLLRADRRTRRRAGPAARARSSAAPARRGTCSASVSASFARVVGLVVGLEQAAPAADHLAQRPEGDALAVRGRAAVVPPDGLDEPVDVLQELPREAALADARRPDDRHEAGPPLAAVAWNRSLSRRSSSSRPTNGASSASERLRPPRSATTRSARHAGTGRGLALEHLLAGRLEHDRPSTRRAASPRRRGRCRAARPTGAGRRC